MPTWDSGASFQAPGKSPSGSETITRVSSENAAELLEGFCVCDAATAIRHAGPDAGVLVTPALREGGQLQRSSLADNVAECAGSSKGCGDTA